MKIINILLCFFITSVLYAENLRIQNERDAFSVYKSAMITKDLDKKDKLFHDLLAYYVDKNDEDAIVQIYDSFVSQLINAEQDKRLVSLLEEAKKKFEDEVYIYNTLLIKSLIQKKDNYNKIFKLTHNLKKNNPELLFSYKIEAILYLLKEDFYKIVNVLSELDSLSATASELLAYAHYKTSSYDKAIDYAHKALEYYKKEGSSSCSFPLYSKALSLYKKGNQKLGDRFLKMARNKLYSFNIAYLSNRNDKIIHDRIEQEVEKVLKELGENQTKELLKK